MADDDYMAYPCLLAFIVLTFLREMQAKNQAIDFVENNNFVAVSLLQSEDRKYYLPRQESLELRTSPDLFVLLVRIVPVSEMIFAIQNAIHHLSYDVWSWVN